jgi:putative hemolysin
VLAFGGVVLALSLCLLVIGELVPKRLALAHPERIAMTTAVPLRRLAGLVGPGVDLLSTVTDAVLGLLSLKVRSENAVSEEEVNTLIDQGLASGVFQKAEKEMVQGVLGLDQMPVTSLMTPRPRIVFLNLNDPEEANWRKIVTSGHSHFPVYQEDRDQVLGMVAVKALWAHSAIGVQTSLKNLLTPPLIVSETSTAIQLLETFKKSGKHAALVADEFGSIQGLVTLIDVMEAIVGDLPERGEREMPAARQRDDGSWLVDATMAVGDVKQLLRIDVAAGEGGADYRTLGGFVLTQFGKIPAAGESFDWRGWRFEVVDMDRRRVDKVLMGRIPPPGAGPVAAE